MYLGVSTATPGLINLAGRKGPQTRQATAAAAQKKRAPKKKAKKKPKKTSKKTPKKKAKKPSKKKTPKKTKKAAKKKVGLFIQKRNIVYHPAVGKVRRLTFLQLVRKLPKAVILRHMKR